MPISLAEKRKRNRDRTNFLYKTSEKYRNRQKNLKLLTAYGITLEQYEKWSEAFGNVCHLCGNKCPSKRRLAVDHDHKTKLVRGLLCINCNKGLGNFKDNIQLLKKAIEYLECSKETEEFVKNALNSIT